MLRKILVFAVIVAVVWLVFRVWRRAPKVAKATDMRVRELYNDMQSGKAWLLIDVRGAKEFNDDLGHIAAAQHIPLEALSSHIGKVAISKEQPIALICRTDSRAREAQRLLLRLGYMQAHVVRGGMQAWAETRLPVVKY